MKLDKITSVRLFSGHNTQLEIIAANEGLDKADVIRKAVKEYVSEYYDAHPFLPTAEDTFA